jgi:membrane dipeptidase
LSAIADGHSDLLFELAFRREEPNPFRAHWLTHLVQGGVSLQVCAVGADLSEPATDPLLEALLQVAAFHRAVRDNPDHIVAVRTRHDLDLISDGTRVGLLLSMEGAEPFGYDVDLADVLWELGTRVVGLTWNRRNLVADGVGETGDGGLSQFGEQLVDRLVDLGMVLDLAHASERTFLRVLERVPRGAAFVSHAGCRAVRETPRNLSDEQLRTLAEHGGVLCVMAHPFAVDPTSPTLDRLIDHVDHAVEIMGEGRVGLGGDFMYRIAHSGALRGELRPDAVIPAGLARDAALAELRGPEEYPNLVSALGRRGYAGDGLEAILGRSLTTFLRRALPG